MTIIPGIRNSIHPRVSFVTDHTCMVLGIKEKDLYSLEQAKAGAWRMGMSLPCGCTQDRFPHDQRNKNQLGSGTQEKTRNNYSFLFRVSPTVPIVIPAFLMR